MKKQAMQSFGFGLLTAAAALLLYTEQQPEAPAALSTEQMIERLQNENYTVEQAGQVPETEQQPEQPAAPAAEPVEATTLSIEPGMTSNEIAGLLKRSGVIQDQSAFNQFLTENGYADQLQTGSFTFEQGMGHQQLAELLTK